MDDYIIMFAVIVGLFLAIGVQLLWFIVLNKRKFRKQEEKLMKQALILVQRMDELEDKADQNGGNKMDKEFVRIAKWIVKKNEEFKDEILEKLDELSEVTEEEIEPEEETKEEKDEELDLDEYDELEDYDGERKIDKVKEKAAELVKDKKKKK